MRKSNFKLSENRMRQVTKRAITEAFTEYGGRDNILKQVRSMRSNILDLSEDGYGILYVDYDPKSNELYAGYATNAGIPKDFTIQYDENFSLDENLEALVEEIYSTEPQD